jgi:hypothetical protein
MVGSLDISENVRAEEVLKDIKTPGDMADHLIGQYFASGDNKPSSIYCQIGARLTVNTIPEAMQWIAHWDVVIRTVPSVSHLVWRNMLYGINYASEIESAGDLSKYSECTAPAWKRPERQSNFGKLLRANGLPLFLTRALMLFHDDDLAHF